MQIRCLSGTLRARAGIQDTKIGSRKIKLAKTSQKYDFPNALRLHYNTVLYTRIPRGFQIFSQYLICVKITADDCGIHNASCENRTPCVFPSQVWHQLISPEAMSTDHSIYNAHVIGDHV